MKKSPTLPVGMRVGDLAQTVLYLVKYVQGEQQKNLLIFPFIQ